MKMTTLCYLERNDEYLMLHRVTRENDCNKDKWIGIGGKFEPGESPYECIRREAMEEAGVTLTDPEFRGIITFVSDEWGTEYMFLFTCGKFEGQQHSCDEGILEWIPKKALYDLELWEGDRIFLELLEQDHPFFSLKLEYQGDRLISAVLDEEKIR